MKRIITSLLIAFCCVCVARADNFVGKYKKIYPLENNAQFVMISEDSIEKIIKQMDKEIAQKPSEEMIKNRDILKKVKQMSLFVNLDLLKLKADLEDKFNDRNIEILEISNSVMDGYDELLSIEKKDIIYNIYAQIKKDKIKELVGILSFGKSRMIFDIEFKKHINLDTWKEELGDISFNGQKLGDIINEENTKE